MGDSRRVDAPLLLIASALLVSLAACGAVETADPTPPLPDADGGGAVPLTDGGGAVSSPAVLVISSYDLRFASAVVHFDTRDPEPAPPPPSLDTTARLDIRQTTSGYDAVFTPRWGRSATLSVSVDARELTLIGQAEITARVTEFETVVDTWSTLVLPRDATGSLTGELKGTGRESISRSPIGRSGSLVGTGSVTPDKTRPELRARLVSNLGPSDRLLPWDKITVEAAEPVSPSGVRERTSLSTSTAAAALALDWTPTGHADSWAGEVAFPGRVSDWRAVLQKNPWALRTPSRAALDLVDLDGPLDALVTFLPLAPPADAIGFDGDVVIATAWGPNEIYGGGKTGATDPRCESGGCQRLGPVSHGACVLERSGFAAQLGAGVGKSRVRLRYRVLAQPGGAGVPVFHGDLLTLEIARPRVEVSDTIVRPGDVKLSKLAAPIDGMGYATDWLDLDVMPTPDAAQLGVAVAIGSAGLFVRGGGGCGDPPPTPVNVEILVERIGWL